MRILQEQISVHASHASAKTPLRQNLGYRDLKCDRYRMKFSVFIKKLSNPRVRRRLKIGLSVWGIAILLALIFKLAYDIGYFKAQSLMNDKNAAIPITHQVLTMESAQRIVTGALKEDPSNPKTIVDQVIDNNQKLSTIIIDVNKQKKIGWIIDMHLFFTGDLFNDKGYNLTDAIAHQYNVNSGNSGNN